MDKYHKDFYKDIFKVILIVINIVLFFNYTANSQIDDLNLFLYFIGFLLTGMVIFNFLNLKKRYNKYVFLVITLPLIFNLFFFINFIFSKNETIEKYNFSDTYTSIGNKWEWNRKGVSSTIKLHTSKYDKNFFFTTFFDYQQIEYKDTITYTFADGLFGIRVLKNYKFTNEGPKSPFDF